MGSYIKVSPTTNVGDNVYDLTVLPYNGSSVIHQAMASSNSTTSGDSTGVAMHYIFMSGYGRTCPGHSCKSYFDDVYVAVGPNSRARVEIGDASTYTSNHKLTMVTPTSWSGTNITGTVRAGSFTSGNAYVYVTDSTGAVNSNGYAVTFGSGSSDTMPPSAPSGLSVI
jgi:hypothetical protein